MYTFIRADVECAAHIRVIHLENGVTPFVHDTWSATALGPFTIGFPNRCQFRLDAHLRQMGYEALNALESYTIDRGDGVSYRIDETIFKAPDHTHIVGIERHDGMTPLGEIHPDTQLGGPICVSGRPRYG